MSPWTVFTGGGDPPCRLVTSGRGVGPLGLTPSCHSSAAQRHFGGGGGVPGRPLGSQVRGGSSGWKPRVRPKWQNVSDLGQQKGVMCMCDRYTWGGGLWSMVTINPPGIRGTKSQASVWIAGSQWWTEVLTPFWEWTMPGRVGFGLPASTHLRPPRFRGCPGVVHIVR